MPIFGCQPGDYHSSNIYYSPETGISWKEWFSVRLSARRWSVPKIGSHMQAHAIHQILDAMMAPCRWRSIFPTTLAANLTMTFFPARRGESLAKSISQGYSVNGACRVGCYAPGLAQFDTSCVSPRQPSQPKQNTTASNRSPADCSTGANRIVSRPEPWTFACQPGVLTTLLQRGETGDQRLNNALFIPHRDAGHSPTRKCGIPHFSFSCHH
jgi:hypothetical protein